MAEVISLPLTTIRSILYMIGNRRDNRQQQQHGQQNSTEHMHLLDAYNNKYRNLIDLVDNLKGYGLERELPLPQVVVLGVQTSGKSSVLEGISGVQLPRGTGKAITEQLGPAIYLVLVAVVTSHLSF